MKKQILNLGKALNKAEQRLIHGGIANDECGSDMDCDPGFWCDSTGACRAICNGVYCTSATSCNHPSGTCDDGIWQED